VQDLQIKLPEWQLFFMNLPVGVFQNQGKLAGDFVVVMEMEKL